MLRNNVLCQIMAIQQTHNISVFYCLNSWFTHDDKQETSEVAQIEANTTKHLNIQYLYEFIGTHTKLQYPSRTLLNALLKNGRSKLSVIRFAHLFILKHYITSYSRKIHMESDSTVKQRAKRVYLVISQIQQYLHYNLPEGKPY